MRSLIDQFERMPEGSEKEFTFVNDEFTDDDFERSTFLRSMDLLVCRRAMAPEYMDSSTNRRLILCSFSGVEKVCSIRVDLKKFPRSAFERKLGPEGYYYHIEYQIAVTFGTILGFKMKWGGNVIGEACVEYIHS